MLRNIRIESRKCKAVTAQSVGNFQMIKAYDSFTDAYICSFDKYDEDLDIPAEMKKRGYGEGDYYILK